RTTGVLRWRTDRRNRELDLVSTSVRRAAAAGRRCVSVDTPAPVQPWDIRAQGPPRRSIPTIPAGVPAMNAPADFSHLLARAREPFPASAKSWIQGSRPDLRVPVRDIRLTNGEVVSVYDTSGPYTDPAASIDVRRGLPGVRSAWIEERGDTEGYTGRAPQAIDDGQP